MLSYARSYPSALCRRRAPPFPLPCSSVAPTSTSSSTTSPCTCPQNDVNTTVKALPECPARSKPDQNNNSFPILNDIQAPPLFPETSDRPTDRSPLDLVMVLDVSGSMKGDKTRLLKQATECTVDKLCPTDRLSVIIFANYAKRETPLQQMTNSGRATAVTAINSLQANGDTNIFAGLQMAARVLEQRRDRNPVSNIILLSDGQDNKDGHVPDFLHSLHHLPPCLRSNDTTINVSQADVPVHTFGFGADHDVTVLRAIADGSGGTFSYVESTDTIQAALSRSMTL